MTSISTFNPEGITDYHTDMKTEETPTGDMYPRKDNSSMTQAKSFSKIFNVNEGRKLDLINTDTKSGKAMN